MVSITPSGFFGSSPKNILILEDFIDNYELEKLNNFIRKNTTWDNQIGFWQDRVITCENILSCDPKILEIINNIYLRSVSHVNNFFNIESTSTGPAMAKWDVGQSLVPHADKEYHDGPNKGQSNGCPLYDLGGIFYINDNYEGGEIYFPNQNLEFKPKAGSGYIFPGDMNYIHGVREIKSGTRYTLPVFWTITKHL